MIDIAALGLMIVIAVITYVRKTSAGVAVLGLLAGVLLDQLLAADIIKMVPASNNEAALYVPVIIRLIIIFLPSLVGLILVKSKRNNAILRLIVSLLLGVLMILYGVKILQTLPLFKEQSAQSALLVQTSPYQNGILAVAAVLAIVEIIVGSGRVKGEKHSKK